MAPRSGWDTGSLPAATCRAESLQASPSLLTHMWEQRSTRTGAAWPSENQNCPGLLTQQLTIIFGLKLDIVILESINLFKQFLSFEGCLLFVSSNFVSFLCSFGYILLGFKINYSSLFILKSTVVPFFCRGYVPRPLVLNLTYIMLLPT